MNTSRLRLFAATVFAFVLLVSVALLVILDPAFRSASNVPGYSSSFSTIDTVTAEGEHHVVIDGLEVAAVDTATWESSLASAALLELPRYFFPDAGRLLVIGLENPAVVRYYALHGWQIDAVEPDGRLSSMARSLFGIDSTVAKLFTISPLQFLQRTADRYRLIIVQGSGKRTVPPYLLTDSATYLLASHLEDEGMIALSALSVGWDSRLVRSIVRTLKASLPTVVAFPIAEPPTETDNVLITAAREEISLRRGLEQDAGLPNYRFSGQYEKNHSWDNRFVPAEGGAVVITEDNNPAYGWDREAQRNVREAAAKTPAKPRF